MTQAEIETTLGRFEGLVKETASQIVAGGVELEFDDIRQLLRVKVWQAVLKFDEQRAAAGKHLSVPRDRYGRSPMERFVYMCVANMRKDIEKRPRRFNISIEAIRDRSTELFDRHENSSALGGISDWFDARYLSVDAEQVFAQIEEEDDLPLPSTLTKVERRVIALRLDGLMLQEIDRALGLSRAQRERVMRSLREKLADWHPSGSQRNAPMPPLPGAEPQRPPAPASLAA